MLSTDIWGMLLLLGVAVAENQTTWPQSLKLTERAVSFGMEKRDGLESAVIENQKYDFQYVVEVFIGTPEQNISVWLDSFGAHSSIFYRDVPDTIQGQYFASNKSSTFRYVDRPRKVNGRWAMDTIRLGPVRRDAEFVYGVNGPSYPALLGFGYPNSRDGNASSFLHEAAKNWTDKRMGLFLSRHSKDKNAHVWDNGAQHDFRDSELMLGGVNSTKISGEIAYSDLVRDDLGGWAINLEAITINNKTIDLSFATNDKNNNKSWPIMNNPIVNGRAERPRQQPSPLIAGIGLNVKGIGVPGDILPRIYENIPGAQPLVGFSVDFPYTPGFTVPCNYTAADIRLTIGGKEYPIDSDDMFKGLSRGDRKDGGGMCDGVFHDTNSTFATLGTAFLKNYYTVFRFDPPAVGFAQLSPDAQPPPVNAGMSRVPCPGLSIWAAGAAVLATILQ